MQIDSAAHVKIHQKIIWNQLRIRYAFVSLQRFYEHHPLENMALVDEKGATPFDR